MKNLTLHWLNRYYTCKLPINSRAWNRRRFDDLTRRIRKIARGHHCFPIHFIVGEEPPGTVGEGGHYVDRHRGKTQKYIKSTRRIEVGIDWFAKHEEAMADVLLPIYHAALLGIEP